MFVNKAFTSATMSFASDLFPALQDVPVPGDGNGIFGYPVFGTTNFFGGASHPVPFRTYIPRSLARCRFSIIKFGHQVAREQWGVNGVTVTGEVAQSTRAYR